MRTRAGQGVHKRIDYLNYRLGFPATRAYETPHLTESARFFFASEDLPAIAALLREQLPDQVAATRREADEICRHRFRLLGYEDLDYGPEIDWHLDRVHGKRAPSRPWFKIPFLDYSAVGDHKVIWELNRHQHLVTLAKAWVLDGEPKPAIELIGQWYSWQRANPYPIGINWCSSLEVAFRSLSWLWVKFLLAECPAVPAAFHPDLLHALALNASYIERYLSTYFSRNTHLLGEALALFFIGTLCPEIPGSRRWRVLGWSLLTREISYQVGKDGMYFEQSLYYHVYALDMFLHARTLAQRNRVEVPCDFDAALERMLRILQVLSQAGPPHSFGDEDGGRLFNPRRNHSEHLTDPLATGGVLLDRRNFLSSTSLTEETIWMFGRQATSSFAAIHSEQQLEAAVFEAAGLYVMASSEGGSQQIVVDAGPMGRGSAGHAHADALSVTLSREGRQWLIDPGTFSYVGPEDERDRFRGTAAHNTLLVDDLDQAEPDGPFGWRSLPEVHMESWKTGNRFSLLAGSHSGYFRLVDPVQHRRFVFDLHGEFWVVRDVIVGKRLHKLQRSWHFAPGLRVTPHQNSFIAHPAEQGKEATRLALLVQESPDWKHELLSAEISSAYGTKQSGLVVRSTARTRLPVACATLGTVLVGASAASGQFRQIPQTSSRGSPPEVYRYDHGETAHLIIFAAPEVWSFDSCESDAGFLYYACRHGEIVSVIACDGSFVRLNGISWPNLGGKGTIFEWFQEAEVACDRHAVLRAKDTIEVCPS